MAHSTTARLRHQIFRLNQGEQADLDFGLGEILPPEDLALILTEEGATWKTIIKDDPYIKARQRLPETVPLRLMKHIGRRCHERAEAAWRWCDRPGESVEGFLG